ncbi:hypothetical protein SISNIDRAFT_458480 [Sistotremastrum niveocremeum HHB9708]|uniref:Protein kinase domain-containing protein n=1 Tax=Sistotremastrum niveocremeum HHB9708 TaxID=1314777 RepID=A0A164QMA9_9AGAM|nr:hypothetical protein SISNIDRAFT_458480 [Sistotremastrum niveocremeum HHB9708]
MTAAARPNAKRLEEHAKYLEKLNDREQRWASYQPWLKSLGYELRPRYQPGWSASWLTSRIGVLDSEDALLPNIHGKIMDATRVRDGRVVAMKLLPTDRHELSIWKYLSSSALSSDPRNHSAPLLDVHPLPDTDDEVLAIMPLLIYFDDPPFETLGEIMLCVHTYLEGLAFLHEHNVAHLDICAANVLQEPSVDLYPKGFHPARPSYYVSKPGSPKIITGPPYQSRTIAPVKYYFIDFGESIKYDSIEDRQLIFSTVGHDLDVPEFTSGAFIRGVDPFRLDVRAMGDMLKAELHEKYLGLDMLKPLIDAMCRDEPERRPTASEALEMMKNIISNESSDSLATFARPSDNVLLTFLTKQYRRHRWRAQLLGRPPIYPEIPGLELPIPKPLNLISRALTHLRLLTS